MQEAGYTCNGFHGSRSYAGTPFSTGRKNNDCAPISENGISVCYANQYSSSENGHRALCYCEEATNRNWFLGARGKTCEETCSKFGRVCNAAKQSMLTTNEL